MPALHTIVYVSSADHLFSEAELEALLAISRERNARDQITGALLYRDGNFMQCLEGEEAAVRATYERIARDPRHHGVVILMDGPIEERAFPGWTMGHLQPTQSEALALATQHWREFDAEGPVGTQFSRGMIALRSFAKRAGAIR